MRLASTVLLLCFGGTAFAGAALDDDKKTPTRTTDPAAAPDTPVLGPDNEVHYGADLRIRHVFLPAGLLGAFVGHTPGGTSNTGIGVDFVRRRGDVELQLGFEYEHINVDQGVFIESGKSVPGDAADFVLSDTNAPENFGWFTIEFTFLNHAPLNKYVALRYGGGFGLGILTGGVYRYDVACNPTATNSNPEPGCVPGNLPSNPYNGTGTTSDDNSGAPEGSPVKYNTPPIFPVVNAIIGVQIKPVDKVVINIEGGIRTLPFFGVSMGYFFN